MTKPQAFTFDPERALDQIGGDRSLLREIAELFFEDSPRMLGDIQAALELQNAQALRNSAHALKGAVANFAADEPRQLAQELEEMGRDGSLQGADEVLEKLEASLQRFEAELRSFLAAG